MRFRILLAGMLTFILIAMSISTANAGTSKGSCVTPNGKKYHLQTIWGENGDKYRHESSVITGPKQISMTFQIFVKGKEAYRRSFKIPPTYKLIYHITKYRPKSDQVMVVVTVRYTKNDYCKLYAQPV